MATKRPTREDIIKAWKEADAKSDKPVGQKDVAREMGISVHWIRKAFPGGGITEMKQRYGIRLSPQEVHRSLEELLAILDEAVLNHKGIPNWLALTHETGIAESTWKKRLGGHRGCTKEEVYRRYGEWLQTKNPKSPNVEIVKQFLHRQEKTGGVDAPSSRRTQTPAYQKGDGRVYGRPLHFANLAYEPTNEQGVVFLFGMVSKALGFDSIEYVGTDFPDCEGKWRIKGKRQLQHVRIEFEFRSSNYDHPTDGCDVVVCWEHNWKECPLPVIELKKEIKELRDRAEFRS